MSRASTIAVIIILVNILLGSVGQISLRYGASHLGDLRPGHGILMSMLGAVKGILSPYIFLGLLLYAVSAVLWILVLNQVRLSFAYPMISLSYVIVVLLSAVILHEKVPTVTIAGLVFICAGVSLIGIGYNVGR